MNIVEAGDERKLQLEELECIRLEAYENSKMYKEYAKATHDKKTLVRTKVTGRVAERAYTRAAAQEAARAAAERELTPFDEVKEFYSHFSVADQKTVYLRGVQIPIDVNSISSFLGIRNEVVEANDAYKNNVTRWKVGNLEMDMVLATIAEPGIQWNSYNPGSGRVDNGIHNRNARGWVKLMVCNLKPLKHETTFSMETALLIYTLMDQGDIHLGHILNKSMYDAAEGAKDRRLAFPVMITKMAAALNVPRYPEDDMYTVPTRTRYCPFGDWKQVKKKARKADLGLRNPPPIPPPIHETQDHPSTSATAVDQPPTAQQAAQPPLVDASCTDIFKKILRRLRRRKQDHRNTQYMIHTEFPEVDFPDVRPVSTSDSDDADYN
ncbi:hypothetical protein PIB30_093111 [Stylosanthes scabra]|uniref:Putative plant transposon protein domain-containing protein n=1 Tax=Stylosanthes scabra TaxID=79078 RepID=A0ABU6TX88_9FABA|nr:hypothetical protein [Stylosanthes scabra]